MASLRREVLGGYRRLMRVRLVAFKDDTAMLEAAKSQLRIEFTKNKDVTDPSKIGQQSASLIISSGLVHTYKLPVWLTVLLRWVHVARSDRFASGVQRLRHAPFLLR